MPLHIIACVFKQKSKWAIGKDGRLILSIPDDLRFFKRITCMKNGKQNVVVMGRKTWESLPFRLPQRHNIVLTRNPKNVKTQGNGVSVMNFQSFCKWYSNHDDNNVFVIGGEEIYKLFFKERTVKINSIYLTQAEFINPTPIPIPSELQEADAFFPICGLENKYSLAWVSEKKRYNFVEYRCLKFMPTIEDSCGKEKEYLNLCKNVLYGSHTRLDRTGVGTISSFGHQIKFDVSTCVPLLTTKRVPWKHVIHELLWFMRGDTDTNILKRSGVSIWNGNSSREFLDSRGLDYQEGILGPCFPPGIMTLTDSGYKCVSEVKDTDLLYSHKGRWQEIIKIHKNKYTGKVYTIQTNCHPEITCTSEHPFMCKTFGGIDKEIEWTSAKNIIPGRHSVGIIINSKNILPDFLPEFISDYMYWWIFGVYTTSGLCHGETQTLFTLNNKTVVEKLKKVFKNKLKTVDSCLNLHVLNDSHLTILFTDNFGNAKKIIPEWIQDAPVVYIESFLKGIKESCTNNNEFSVDIAYSIQRLYLKLGIKCCVYKTLSGYVVSKQGQDYKNIHILEGHAWYIVEHKYEQNVSDQVVYNFFVNEDNTYTVHNLAVHNCYGWQWRHFGAPYNECFADTSKNHGKNKTIGGFDQLNYVIKELKENPFSRRALMSFWNPPDLEKMALPPCHYSVQFYSRDVSGTMFLDCHFTMRSTDLFLGAPFNLFSYTVFLYIVALKVNMLPGILVYTGGDVHIYNNHVDQVKKQLSRNPRPFPVLLIDPIVKNKEIKDISIEDFDIAGYFPHPGIKADMAI